MQTFQIEKKYFFNTHSIWKDYPTDFLLLYFPGLLAIAFSHYLPSSEDSTLFLIFAFIATGFLDSGHVYVTLWRTYFLPRERQRSFVYWWAPVFFFCLFYLWVFQQWGYLAAFVVYATVFHNIRQLLGVSKWYQRQNKSWTKLSDIFLYLMCIVPFVGFHFRADTQLEHYYATDELFRYPSSFLLQCTVGIYFIVLLSWLSFEIIRWKRHQEWNRFFSVLFAAIFYGYAFFIGKTIAQVLFPLVVSHGFAYLALTEFSLRKIHQKRRRRSFYWSVMIFLTALVLGGLEFSVESEWLRVDSPLHALTTAALLTPLFCHYFFDSFLWKKSHPDSFYIYNQSK